MSSFAAFVGGGSTPSASAPSAVSFVPPDGWKSASDICADIIQRANGKPTLFPAADTQHPQLAAEGTARLEQRIRLFASQYGNLSPAADAPALCSLIDDSFDDLEQSYDRLIMSETPIDRSATSGAAIYQRFCAANATSFLAVARIPDHDEPVFIQICAPTGARHGNAFPAFAEDSFEFAPGGQIPNDKPYPWVVGVATPLVCDFPLDSSTTPSGGASSSAGNDAPIATPHAYAASFILSNGATQLPDGSSIFDPFEQDAVTAGPTPEVSELRALWRPRENTSTGSGSAGLTVTILRFCPLPPVPLLPVGIVSEVRFGHQGLLAACAKFAGKELAARATYLLHPILVEFACAARDNPTQFATTWHNVVELTTNAFNFLRPGGEFATSPPETMFSQYFITNMFRAVAFKCLVARFQFLRDEGKHRKQATGQFLRWLSRATHGLLATGTCGVLGPPPISELGELLLLRPPDQQQSHSPPWLNPGGMLHGWGRDNPQLIHPWTLLLPSLPVPVKSSSPEFANEALAHYLPEEALAAAAADTTTRAHTAAESTDPAVPASPALGLPPPAARTSTRRPEARPTALFHERHAGSTDRHQDMATLPQPDQWQQQHQPPIQQPQVPILDSRHDRDDSFRPLRDTAADTYTSPYYDLTGSQVRRLPDRQSGQPAMHEEDDRYAPAQRHMAEHPPLHRASRHQSDDILYYRTNREQTDPIRQHYPDSDRAAAQRQPIPARVPLPYSYHSPPASAHSVHDDRHRQSARFTRSPPIYPWQRDRQHAPSRSHAPPEHRPSDLLDRSLLGMKPDELAEYVEYGGRDSIPLHDGVLFFASILSSYIDEHWQGEYMEAPSRSDGTPVSTRYPVNQDCLFAACRLPSDSLNLITHNPHRMSSFVSKVAQTFVQRIRSLRRQYDPSHLRSHPSSASARHRPRSYLPPPPECIERIPAGALANFWNPSAWTCFDGGGQASLLRPAAREDNSFNMFSLLFCLSSNNDMPTALLPSQVPFDEVSTMIDVLVFLFTFTARGASNNGPPEDQVPLLSALHRLQGMFRSGSSSPGLQRLRQTWPENGARVTFALLCDLNTLGTVLCQYGVSLDRNRHTLYLARSWSPGQEYEPCIVVTDPHLPSGPDDLAAPYMRSHHHNGPTDSVFDRINQLGQAMVERLNNGVYLSYWEPPVEFIRLSALPSDHSSNKKRKRAQEGSDHKGKNTSGSDPAPSPQPAVPKWGSCSTSLVQWKSTVPADKRTPETMSNLWRQLPDKPKFLADVQGVAAYPCTRFYTKGLQCERAKSGRFKCKFAHLNPDSITPATLQPLAAVLRSDLLKDSLELTEAGNRILSAGRTTPP